MFQSILFFDSSRFGPAANSDPGAGTLVWFDSGWVTDGETVFASDGETIPGLYFEPWPAGLTSYVVERGFTAAPVGSGAILWGSKDINAALQDWFHAKKTICQLVPLTRPFQPIARKSIPANWNNFPPSPNLPPTTVFFLKGALAATPFLDCFGTRLMQFVDPVSNRVMVWNQCGAVVYFAGNDIYDTDAWAADGVIASRGSNPAKSYYGLNPQLIPAPGANFSATSQGQTIGGIITPPNPPTSPLPTPPRDDHAAAVLNQLQRLFLTKGDYLPLYDKTSPASTDFIARATVDAIQLGILDEQLSQAQEPNRSRWAQLLSQAGVNFYQDNPEAMTKLQTVLANFGLQAFFTPLTINLPATVQFQDLSTGHRQVWSWNFGDGAKSTEQNPAHTYTVAGNYNATMAVAGPGGVTFKTIPISVLDPHPPLIVAQPVVKGPSAVAPVQPPPPAVAIVKPVVAPVTVSPPPPPAPAIARTIPATPTRPGIPPKLKPAPRRYAVLPWL